MHNHTAEFDASYLDNGVAEDRLGDPDRAHRPALRRLPRSTPFWASDAFNDATGAATAAFINKYPTRIKLMHVKDGINVDHAAEPDRQPRRLAAAFGTGEVDYRPIFAAAQGQGPVLLPGARRRHAEQHGRQPPQPQGPRRERRPGAVLGLPTTFPTVAAGTAGRRQRRFRSRSRTRATRRSRSRTSRSPATTPTGSRLPVRERRAPRADFQVPDAAGCTAGAIAPNATCFVNVGFKPTSTSTKSVARLRRHLQRR